MYRELQLVNKGEIILHPYSERPIKGDEIRLNAIISAISHGTELNLYKGMSPFADKVFDTEKRIFREEKNATTYPCSLGYEWIGRIIEVGDDVDNFSVGDVLHLPLPHRETHTVSTSLLKTLGVTEPLPSGLESQAATFIASTSIVLQAIHDANIKLGSYVAIFGMGTLGQLAVRMAKLSGASRIDVIDPIVEKRTLALKSGADKAYDPITQDYGMEIKSEQNNEGVDIAIEISGNYVALHAAIRSVKKGGRVVAAGFYQGGAEQLFLGEEWLHNRVSMVASMRGWGNNHRDELWNRTRLRKASIELLSKKILCPNDLITHQFDFSQVPKAYDLLEHSPPDLMKIIINYNQLK